MELRHIRYFKAVAEVKNFTRAAEKLAIAQPPLSRQIQDLEAELGTQLFIRSPHKVTLTEEGELFLQYASYALIWKKDHTLSHVAQEFLSFIREGSENADET